MPINRSEYNRDQSIDLNLTKDELISISVALKEQLLREYSKTFNIKESPRDSHIGKLLETSTRIEMALLGNKNWNNRECFPQSR